MKKMNAIKPNLKVIKIEYVMIKRCINCGATNDPKYNCCKGCGYMFTGEMSFKDWIDYCTELSKKAALKEETVNQK